MADLTRRNVRATYLSTDGRRLRGKVMFTPSVTIYDEEENVVLLPRPIEAFPDDDGLVSIDLPITNDPTHNPIDWHYIVVEDFENGPSRQRYWIQVPAGSTPIELADQIVDIDPPKPFVKLIVGPQGPGATVVLGSVTTANPNENPSVTNTGTSGDAIFNFDLPRSATLDLGATTVLDSDQDPSVAESTSAAGDKEFLFSLPQAKDLTLGTVTVVNPDQNPAITDSGDVNGAVYDFDVPRAPDFTVGAVTTLAPGSSATVADVGVNGDIELNFGLPRGADGTGTAYYGQMSTQSAQTVTIVSAGSYVDMAIAGTFDSASSFGTVAPTTASFGVKNDSGATQLFTVIATADVEIGNNKTAGFRLAVNGVALTETTCTATTGTQNFAKLMTQWFVELDQGDEVSLLVANLTDTTDIDVDRSKIVVFTAGRQGDPGVVAATAPITYDSGTQTVGFDGALDDLSNVSSSAPSGGNGLIYNGTSGEWEPTALDTDDVAEGSNLYYTDARVEAIAAPLYFTENVQTGNYTLALSDVAKVVAMNNSGAATVTVPPNSSVAFPVGSVVNVYAMTANTVTVAAGSGVTVRNAGDIANQYIEVSLRKRATDEWVLSGNMA